MPLASLHGASRLVLESIAVLRKASSVAGWKEEDSRTQAIFATICSLADKAQPPAASSMAVYQEGLCIIVRVCAAQDWPKELFESQLRFLKKEPGDSCMLIYGLLSASLS